MYKSSAWQTLFDHHAPCYMDEPFTRNTRAEVDFLVREFGLPPGIRLLDVGCGTGRHAVELAQRGFRVTGVDLSAGMLAEAQKAARRVGAEVEFIHSDIMRFDSRHRFDGVICLCEGAFGLLDATEDPIRRDVELLRRLHGLLLPGGKLILTALNGLAMVRRATPEQVEEGAFDPHNLVEVSEMTFQTETGPATVKVWERGFAPSELALKCDVAGFDVLYLYGGTAGA